MTEKSLKFTQNCTFYSTKAISKDYISKKIEFLEPPNGSKKELKE